MKNSTLLKKAIKKGFSIVYVDLETSPHKLWGYGLFNQNFSLEQIEEPGKITSIAWLHENTKLTHSLGWSFNHKTGKGDDTELLRYITPILNKADLIIGQNSDGFDLKWLQWQLNLYKLPPLNLKTAITLDTLKLSKKVFRPPSHKLDHRSRSYGFGGKIDQTMRDIIAVAKGDEVAQAKRIKYNIKDTADTRKVFWKELDYYTLPKTFVKMLLDYIKDDKPFCKKCAVRRQKRFEVKKRIRNHSTYLECKRCGSLWKQKTK